MPYTSNGRRLISTSTKSTINGDKKSNHDRPQSVNLFIIGSHVKSRLEAENMRQEVSTLKSKAAVVPLQFVMGSYPVGVGFTTIGP